MSTLPYIPVITIFLIFYCKIYFAVKLYQDYNQIKAGTSKKLEKYGNDVE